jgi:hypothetical protein
LRREHFVRRVPIKELVRRYGIDRNTVRALRSDRPARYERPARPSKFDPFKDEIHRLLLGERGAAGRPCARVDRAARFRRAEDDRR